MQVNVKGGTNAGWRTVRAKSKDWICPRCQAKNRYYWVSCPVCKAARPEED